MYRHPRTGSLLSALIVATALLLPAPAHPWGWATHVYLMENLGPANDESFYGALVPDFPQVIPQTEYLFFLQNQTHYKFDRLVDKAPSFGLADLGAGFAVHNERSGADHSAHVAGFTNPPGTGGYVVFKSGLLLSQTINFPAGSMTIFEFLESLLENNGIPPGDAAVVAAQIAPEAAHSIIEDGIDILLQQDVDPAAGCLLLNSALARDADSVQALLVKSYAKNFAARFKIRYETAAAIISGAEAGFQELMTGYGAVLCPIVVQPFQPVEGLAALDAFRLNEFIKAVTGLPSLDPAVTPEDAVAVLLAVPPLVQDDYRTELSETLGSLQEQLSASR